MADHAVRAQSSFPTASNEYYGVDYTARPQQNDLRHYSHIPVPTSYMVCNTDFDFFGAYDFDAEGGFIHVANKHIAPGKKQWTWGNEKFGWAWDRELTDRVSATHRSAPYIELMAGAYTDNQPDFSYLTPFETKTFCQYWWPYKKIGPVQNANKDAAIRLVKNKDGTIALGAASSSLFENVHITLCNKEQVLLDTHVDLSPDTPWHVPKFHCQFDEFHHLTLHIGQLISYQPVPEDKQQQTRDVATEPSMPEDIESIEELNLVAEHLELYRHPTRYPEIYWDEVLNRDENDFRTNIAYGKRKLSTGQFSAAIKHLSVAVKRITGLHPNPSTGEAHYFLGLAYRFQHQFDLAYNAFYKATWNSAWRSAAFYELACIDSRNKNFAEALNHCEQSLTTNTRNNKAVVLKAIMLEKLGRNTLASEQLTALLEIDPLDHWARFVLGDTKGFLAHCRNDAQTIIDLAYDCTDAGLTDLAVSLISLHHSQNVPKSAVPNPLSQSSQTRYILAWLTQDINALNIARSSTSDYFFPSRLHDQIVLKWACEQPGENSHEAFALGNYYFNHKRHQDAIYAWQQVAENTQPYATTCRNLGIAYWNIKKDSKSARAYYLKSLTANPNDARIFSEYDQLCEKLGDSNDVRLQQLQNNIELVMMRDDCTVSYITLLNSTGNHFKALEILQTHRFHPWEGGEGKVLAQYTKAMLLTGQDALKRGTPELALAYFTDAMTPPTNLGEAYHLLQATTEISYWQGKALHELNRHNEALEKFTTCVNDTADFKDMAVTEYSESTYFRGLALIELNRKKEATALFDAIKKHQEFELNAAKSIDYFATSLPMMLVFESHDTELLLK
ncbi:DUF5107 domain-containing protein [Paraglaciecola aquimarina]|uniref:DUF5107 domain-containing protein n=1 Tax=Paraglaciecola aquimarina TaxID=1235557 RepID=A0ABU3SS05_9ALTE|nr:DUF5107 domain-containing protein [Paraglaciecola aquimarina]MDU0352770.1 DUF5107 domain-containing protein [Paraglaciecola aquimarina]